MKALFVHSARFVRTPDGQVYSNSQFPYEGWARYLKYFDELTIICRMADRAQAPDDWDLSSGPRVTYVGTPDDHGKPLMQLQNGPKRRVIRKQFDAEHYDAVIVRQSMLGWLVAAEARRRGIPWAVEVICNAWDSYWNYGTLVGKLYAPVAAFDSYRWIKKADFARYVTREYLQRTYPCRGFSVGVSDVKIDDVPEVILEQRIARWQTAPTDPNKPLVIGLIGTLFNRYKGVHVALRALRKLAEQGLRLQLRVLGDGHFETWRLEAGQLGVADLLFLDGCVPSGEPVMRWLDGLDIYIQPSLTEGLPRALIEAMSRGLPALGSTCGGIPELLAKECLHRPGDDKTLAGHLARMVQDKPWRIAQARRNFSEAKYYCSEQSQANRHKFWSQFAEYARKQVNI